MKILRILWVLSVLACVKRPPETLPPQRFPETRGSDNAASNINGRLEEAARNFAANRTNRASLDALMLLADSAYLHDSMSVAASVARATAFAAEKRPLEAALAYRRSLSLNPEYPGLANSALGQFWRAGLYDEAYLWARRQAEREPSNLSVLFNYNVAAGFLIEPARAESLMLRALQINPRFATAHGELAFLAQYTARPQDAVRHMEEAVRVDSTSAESAGGLAQMLIPAGQVARALTVLRPVLLKDSAAVSYGGRSVLSIYGWALKEAGDTLHAFQIFDRVLARLRLRELGGESTYQLFREMSAVHALKGDRAEAIVALRKAVESGMHTFASWDLSDPMLASIRHDPEVESLVERMRADTRAMRARVGLR